MTDGSLAALVVLGAFHGLNPAMGWLFAVARGLQERSRTRVVQALPAIAAGHAASVGAVALLVALTRSVVAARVVAVAGGVVLVGFGLWRLLSSRHFRWVGMRLSLPQLAGWSFLMSSAHGAGLMLLPLITASGRGAGTGGAHAHGLGHAAGSAVSAAVFVTGVHTLAMFATAGIVALLVYDVLGLRVLRAAWLNLDRVWAVALVGAGAFALVTA
ncbi:hypothetical protein DZF91_18455 [Actinomadura logoneensis]|uniref:Uncharacterized protein n=1 Tax=Actinomadura logoneensis TaxID=2293572 RepID=A0A372JK10_9ACTN|nr:hypothetical protein [Actinomadura logoneensis]RFU40184.1 hypothetical protein DZF91_18455 [Actinomadura logoneensis]